MASLVRITEKYRELLYETRRQKPSFGSAGGKGVPLVRPFNTKDVLDYGCGNGHLALGLGFKIQEYDPGKKGKETEPVPAEVVYCGDVMEHVEEECVQEVLAHIKGLVKPGGHAVFIISCIPSVKFLADGTNAHITVKSGEEWRDLLHGHFARVAMTPGLERGDMFYTCSNG